MAEFKVQTKGFNDIVNINEEVKKTIKDSGIEDGVASIFVVGSTAGITAIEYEKGVLKDLKEVFEKIAPKDGNYNHEEAWHDGNGFSHIRAGLLKPSLTVPIENGKILIGTWQQIVLIDFDNKPRERTIVVKILKSG